MLLCSIHNFAKSLISGVFSNKICSIFSAIQLLPSHSTTRLRRAFRPIPDLSPFAMTHPFLTIYLTTSLILLSCGRLRLAILSYSAFRSSFASQFLITFISFITLIISPDKMLPSARRFIRLQYYTKYSQFIQLFKY